MTFLLLLGVFMLFAAGFVLIDVATMPARQRKASIGRATRLGGGDLLQHDDESFRARAVRPAISGLGRLVTRLFPAAGVDSIEKRLVTAGLRRRLSPQGFLAGKAAMTLLGLAVGAFAGTSGGDATRGFLLSLAFGAAFFILPDRILAGRIRNRKEEIEGDLPDALDLLAISVEAGLSLDGALDQLVEHMEGPLIDELEFTLGEIRIGQSRAEALRNLGERVDVRSITTLTPAIIQSEQLGMSLGRILRTQARDARIQRQASAEERASKMPIKMLLPTALFIFPALLLVVVGPALITLSKVLH